MSAFHPLPSRPNLEFEHKQAKALLRQLRAGDADALARARARHPQTDVSAPGQIKLADAQLVVAREYGFASWPRLVRYFGDIERQRHVRRGVAHEPQFYEGSVRSLLAEHRAGRATAARTCAAYVPQFYGKPLEEILAATVTVDDARLAVARMYGFASWQLLLEPSAEDNQVRRRVGGFDPTPWEDARKAIAAADLPALQRVVDAHAELLEVRDDGANRRPSLLGTAMACERRLGIEALRPIMEWLTARGFDHQRALNEQLCGHLGMTPETVHYLLERGADPNWVAPNGIPVLEHALINYWNGTAVDVLARHAVPRQALWISAGLGDIESVRTFLDRNGKPTPAARRIRPDFDAAGFFPMVAHPDPEDEEILLEAFLIAMLNGRTAVLDYMMARGTPVNSLLYGSSAINFAVGNSMTNVVESLVRGGADLDLEGTRPDMSAREIARELLEQAPESAERRRVVELCGLDPDAIIAERNARPHAAPRLHSHFEQAVALASDDAARLGQSDIRPENLLFGTLRNREGALMAFTRMSEMDLDRFRADVRNRMHVADDRLDHPPLPMHPDAQALIDAAIDAASERRRDLVTEFFLLYALLRAERSPAAEQLARYGGKVAKLLEQLERAL